jgi:hypothetical protein
VGTQAAAPEAGRVAALVLRRLGLAPPVAAQTAPLTPWTAPAPRPPPHPSPQGVDPVNADAVQGLVVSKLEELAKTGFTPSAVEAAINTIEFSLRENNTGSFPRGLSLMLRAVGAWIYDRDPYVPIQVGGNGGEGGAWVCERASVGLS